MAGGNPRGGTGPAPPRATRRSHLRRIALGVLWFRQVVVAALVATVAITWPLWNLRTAPPLVPWLPLPVVPLGAALVGALLLALLRPRAGALLALAVFAWGCSIDQTRLHPGMVSLLLLLVTTAWPRAVVLARVHLATLWFWAGCNKFLSEPFMAADPHWLLASLLAAPPSWLAAAFPSVLVAAEVGLGVAALATNGRVLVPWWAAALHAGILVALVPHHNAAVWPWNVALALSGFLLFAPARRPLLADVFRSSRAVRLVAAGLALYPVGSHFGVGDPYLAHHLYTDDIPGGFVCRADGARMQPRPGLNSRLVDRARGLDCLAIDPESAGLGVPPPPRRSYFAAYFAADCRAGEILLVRAGAQDRDPYLLPCANPP